MSIHPRSWTYLTCDKCGKEGPEGCNAVEVRGKAWAQGWRFPPRRLKSGEKSQNRFSDICPDCQKD